MGRYKMLVRMSVLVLVVLARDAVALNGSWSTVPAISGRVQHSMIYESAYNRLVTFGGSDGTQKLGEAWQIDLTHPAWTWTKILVSANPQARVGHSLIYDAVGGRMIMFGGRVFDQGLGQDMPVNEVWALPLLPFIGEWQLLGTTGITVPPLAWHTAVFDSRRRAMVVFGGEALGVPVTNGVYSLDLATLVWQERMPGPGRRYHAAAYDSLADRMYVFGGEQLFMGQIENTNTTWQLNLAAGGGWSLVNALNPPYPVSRHGMIFDSNRRELVVYGGSPVEGNPAGGSTYRLPVDVPTQWNVAQAPSPNPKRQEFAVAYDRRLSRMLVFGGWEGRLSEQIGVMARNDTWSLELDDTPAWSTLHLRPYGGSWFTEHTLTYEPVGNRTILFGGVTADGIPLNGLFARGFSYHWDQWGVAPATGSPPPGRYSHSAAYDYTGEQALYFGGWGASGILSDVWSLGLANGGFAWTQLSPSGTGPGPREGHTAVVADQVVSNRRMIVFGGFDGTSVRNDVWVLKLNGTLAWELMQTTGHAPSPRRDHTAVYDYIGNQMIVFGGEKADGSLSDEVFTLNLGPLSGLWTKVNVQGPRPPARASHVAVMSPYSDRRMEIFSGRGAGGLLRDAWAINTGGFSRWDAITMAPGPSPGEREGAAAANTAFGEITIAGGRWNGLFETALENFNDTWLLNFNPADPDPSAMRSPREEGRVALGAQVALDLESVTASQAILRVTVHGVPAGALGLDVYDVSGHRHRRLPQALQGSQRVTWDLRDDRGVRVPSGIYFVRLRGPGVALTRRVAIIH